MEGLKHRLRLRCSLSAGDVSQVFYGLLSWK